MRKIIAALFVSLDGVVELPERWNMPYFNDEMGATVGAAMAESDAMMMGRVLYQEWAAYWPTQGSDNQMASYMNSIPKFVVSTTLTNADAWQHSTLIVDDVTQAITALKQQPGKNITISGSPTLVRSLLRLGLLDELQLMLHPIVVGNGKHLFPDGGDQQALALVESKTFSTGVVYLTYRPAS